MPSSEFMQMASLGYSGVVADMLWFRTIQYYGGYRQNLNDIKFFNQMVDVITDLDPRFTAAYKLGALVISEDMDNFEDGVLLMEKGLRNNPQDYWLTFEMGFLYYLQGRDYVKAEKYFKIASTLPGSDGRAARFAANAAAKGGRVEDSIILWKELARNSDEKYIRELAERYIEKYEKELQSRKGTGS
jgi:tetratricopeptide (TPR) repeat protein